MTELENYEGDERYPIIWELQEGTSRDGGLEVLTIPVISKDAAFAYADRRAGSLLELGKQQGVNQEWQDYGTLPRGRDYVRQVCAPWRSLDELWQHVRIGFVITADASRW